MKAETLSAIHGFCAHAEGWTKPEKAIEFAELIMEVKPALTTELGVFAGGSFIPQALALKELGAGIIVGVDSWKATDTVEGENKDNAEWWTTKVDLDAMLKLTMNAIWQHELDAAAIIVRAASQNAVPLFAGHQIDILNIDANHSEIASVRDVTLYLPFVRPSGYIWFDDCEWPSTQAALSLVETQCDRIRDHGTYRLYQKRSQ